MANVIRYFPTQAINFSIKDALTRKINGGIDAKKQPWRSFGGSLISGGTAGSIGLLIVYPLDFSRTRLGVDVGKAANERQFNGLIDCCMKIFKTDGIHGLYRGFGISVIGIFVYRSFYFGGYDTGKSLIWRDE
jgi:solute carrier family 25 (adenine nucleotide translocator) protein 4/5/6/31